MMTKNFVSAGLGVLFFAFSACGSSGGDGGKATAASAGAKDTTVKAAADATASTIPGAADTAAAPATFSGKVPAPSAILSLKEFPILSYHQIPAPNPTHS